MLRKSCIDQRVHEWDQNPRILFEIHGLAVGVNALTEIAIKLQDDFSLVFMSP